MSNGLPKKADISVKGQPVDMGPVTYSVAKRMEDAGRLRPGGALMLAVALASTPKPQGGKPKRGKNERHG